jgi:hypothetical protein
MLACELGIKTAEKRKKTRSIPRANCNLLAKYPPSTGYRYITHIYIVQREKVARTYDVLALQWQKAEKVKKKVKLEIK